MDDSELLTDLKAFKDNLIEIKERLRAVEIEQRRIREDLLSGEPKARMKKRILQNKPDNIKDLRKKIDEKINIKI